MGSLMKLSVAKGGTHPLPSPPVNPLSRMFEDNVVRYPNSTALIYKDIHSKVCKLTYSELEISSNRLARAILEHIEKRGGEEGKDWVVAVSVAPSEHLVSTLLAIWKSGAAYLPLDTSAPQRVQHILQEAKPALVITDQQQEKWDPVLKNYNTISFSRLQQEAEELSNAVLEQREMVPMATQPMGIILYTSGSTGVPKGVRLPHQVVLNRLLWQWREFPYSPTERICVFKTTLTFVDAVSEIWGPLLHPAPLSLLVVPKEVTKDPERLIPLLEEYQVERLLVVPTLLRAILLYLSLKKQNQLTKLKVWVCSGEPLVKSLAEQFLTQFAGRDVALCNFYGSTEVMGDVTYHVIRSLDDLAFDKVPIGKPLDNTAIYLLDKQLSPVPLGEVGELYVAGLNVCAGYVNNRDPHKFVANPHTVDPDMSRLYQTGDYGRLVKGVVMYEGRTDSQVKVRGHRVDLAEVDAALNKLPLVDKVAVLCYQPSEVNQAVIAYVTLSPNTTCTGEDIETILQSHLAIYAIPQVLIIEKIPLLNNGKVDRQTLLKSYAQLNKSNGEITDTNFDLTNVTDGQIPQAKCLLRTVASVLGSAARARISLDANFYQLGGNSLNSVLTVTKLRDQGYMIGITDFLSAPTLRSVVDKMIPEEQDTDVKSTFSSPPNNQYTVETIQETHKTDVYRIISDSFYAKGDLEQCINPKIPMKDYIELLDKIWEPLKRAELSFVLRSRQTGEIVSVALSFDAHDEPPVSISGSLNIVFEFLEFVEAPIRDHKLPQGKGKIVHAFMMGTEKTLTAAENVSTMQAMEEEVLNIAKRRGFLGIFTTNTSPLTKQLGTDVFNYKVMSEYQANKYIAPDGSRPFIKADDSLKASVAWKEF